MTGRESTWLKNSSNWHPAGSKTGNHDQTGTATFTAQRCRMAAQYLAFCLHSHKIEGTQAIAISFQNLNG
jgi:hypothetical protein